ncbi:MAG: hypothetical protein MUO52_09575 [Desulfobacterales bacterium]|nr:hypothetical protein [Desulfobacterales bacterium]
MARSNEIMVVEDEAGRGDLLFHVPSRMGRLVPLYRDRLSLMEQARRAEFKRKVIALIEATSVRTKEEEVTFGVGQLENPFPFYRFL